MADNYLSTDPYKGVRDFYPEDMAVQRYIFDVWAATAESFGFERYDASVLEPSILYKSKGAENEEMVNEQTYTFIDRGEREVTLRPEMTPTVARMVAGRRRELSLPVRWYSIPNLFRYERPQRGRLREHWQLNCDIFGTTDYTADVEIIALAYQMLLNFGANENMFEIRINNRQLMTDFFSQRYQINDPDVLRQVSGILDRKQKVTSEVFNGLLEELVQDRFENLRNELELDIDSFVSLLNTENQNSTILNVKRGLAELGITNVVFDASLARGFNYYTGTIFEIFDVSGENNRAMLGGGRYDNLTGMFSADPISGIGFGMGDVTMRDFLETHNLMTSSITAPTVMVIPMEANQNLAAQKIAMEIRRKEISVATDIGTRKLGKKISDAAERLVEYIIVVGEDELTSGTYTLKNLIEETEMKGTIDELITHITEAE